MKDSKYQISVYDWVKDNNPTKKNLIIGASGGSGKTTTIINAMQYMKGDVLCMAFGKKAAFELGERIKRMALPNINSSTIHSLGKSMLYKSFGNHTVTDGKVGYIVDKFCKTDELKKCRTFISKLVGLAKQSGFGIEGATPISETQAWRDLVDHYDLSPGLDVSLSDLIDISKEVLIDSNRDTRRIDFNDMQYLPLFYDVKCKKYDWVVIDEAQDTNVCRKLIVKKVLKEGGRVIFVGDKNQAIFGFSGAESDSMDILKEMFDCEKLPLPICYRCANVIINYAKQYDPTIEGRDGAPEGTLTYQPYMEFINNINIIKFNRDIGIICRNNAPLVALAFSLIRKGVGCRIEGREIGNDLKKMVNKWKRVTNLDELSLKLTEFIERETTKNISYVKLQRLEDQYDTMMILIDRVKSFNKNDLKSLDALITSMFSDSTEKNIPDIVTLSSVHKAKGLEWETVYWLGDKQFSPSKYATQEHQLDQERNIQYVACTRAMMNLIHITDCPAKRSLED